MFKYSIPSSWRNLFDSKFNSASRRKSGKSGFGGTSDWLLVGLFSALIGLGLRLRLGGMGGERGSRLNGGGFRVTSSYEGGSSQFDISSSFSKLSSITPSV